MPTRRILSALLLVGLNALPLAAEPNPREQAPAPNPAESVPQEAADDAAQGIDAPSPQASAEPDPAADFISAHQSIQYARLSTTYTATYTGPNHVESTPSDYILLYDRQNSQLRIDRPGFSVACDGEHVTLISPSIPDRYLQVPLDGPLTYARLIEIVPDLADPIAPELILLLEADPAPWLSAGNTPALIPLKPDRDDPLSRQRFNVDTQLGAMTLVAHPDTDRISEALQIADEKHLAGSGLTDARFEWRVVWDSIDEAIDEEDFALDIGEAEQVDSMQAFLAPPTPPPSAVPPGGGGGGPTLIGLELPEVELGPSGGGEAIALSDLGAEACADGGLLIIEFYANWTRPSAGDIPVLVEFQDWCEENDKPVTVVLIAVMQKRKETQQWLDLLAERTGTPIDLPVLLDPGGQATQALRLPGIPRTMILRDGKIIEVWGNVKPTFAEDLREKVDGWLDAGLDDE